MIRVLLLMKLNLRDEVYTLDRKIKLNIYNSDLLDIKI